MAYFVTNRRALRRSPMGDDVSECVANGGSAAECFDNLFGGGDQASPGSSTSTSTPTPTADELEVTAAGARSIDGFNKLAVEDFNCARIPGVCRPMSFPASAAVQKMQLQLNRVAQAKGFPRIGVDGDVGPQTIALLKRVQPLVGSFKAFLDTSTIGVAVLSPWIGTNLQAFADSLGAPSVAAAPPSAPPMVSPRSGGPDVPAPKVTGSILDAFSGMTDTQKLLFGAIALGIGATLLGFGRKKRK